MLPEVHQHAWLTTPEVADRVRLSIRQVQRLMGDTMRAGIREPWTKVGRAVRWNAALVDPELGRGGSRG